MSVTFAGVPHNFAFNTHGQTAAPMTTAPVPIAEPSKVVPGAPATGQPDPNTPQAPGVAPRGQSPLDKYAEFFNNTPVDPAKVPPKVPTILDATPQDYTKVAEKLDFSSVMTAERQTAIQGGGAGASKALVEILNDFGRQLFTQAASTATQVTKKGIEISAGELQTKMNQALVLAQSGDKIGATNAVLTNPIYAPLVASTQQRFLSVKPDLTAQQLADLTIEYFNNMGKPVEQQQQQQGSEDPLGLAAFFDLK